MKKAAGFSTSARASSARRGIFNVAALPTRETIAPLLARIGLDHVRWQSPVIGFARPGMELDFGGIGKEYAVDRAVRSLAQLRHRAWARRSRRRYRRDGAGARRHALEHRYRKPAPARRPSRFGAARHGRARRQRRLRALHRGRWTALLPQSSIREPACRRRA